LYIIKRKITYQTDMRAAARRMVPLLVSAMVWAFSTYLVLKGIRKLIKLDIWTALAIGLIFAVVAYFLVKPLISRAADNISNDKAGVNSLFTIPLIFAAALLSFAHGANDVANAVGPLAAINDAIQYGGIASQASIPLWVMLIGALGIAIGLALYGPKMIRTVGTEITELDQSRAFSVAMAAAITVIIASQLGLPVSSTHIAVGAIFGVGFLREYLKASYAEMEQEIIDHHMGKDHDAVESFLYDFRRGNVDEKGKMLRQLKEHTLAADLTKKERKTLKRVYRTELVKRSALIRIVAAWIITVPISGLMAAFFYYTIRGMMLP
jgi:PiT family inorganic phosphate transporter